MDVDVVIDNFDYGRFLGAAVDSALAQTYDRVRVIVVDDGSTDESREILAGYGSRIDLVLKSNGGQASALNAGASRAEGDIVIFLDSDDMLAPRAAEIAVDAFSRHSAAVKVQYRMQVIDEVGTPTGVVKPHSHLPLPSGDLRTAELTSPFDLVWLPNGASAYRSEALRRILPIPEDRFAQCPDWYLVHLIALLGEVVSLEEIGASYRVHGSNRYERPELELDLDHIRQAVTYAAATRGELYRLARELSLPLPYPSILSVADVANRLVSLKLDAPHHPLTEDTLARLHRDGIRAAARREDIGWTMKVVFVAWMTLIRVAPGRAAPALAGLLLPARRRRVNTMLGRLHRRAKAT